jgi:hypothetical protein
VIVTTPNVEYSVHFEALAPDRLRRQDHHLEWTRDELQAWARGAAERFAYTVAFAPVGPESDEVGSPTQMGVLSDGHP